MVVYNASKELRDDSVTVDRNHKYEIKVLGISGISRDIIDPSTISWTSSDPSVCTISASGEIVPVADGRAVVTGVADGFNDSLVVRVENPIASVTSVENGPLEPATWQVTQAGGKNRVMTSLDNGFRIEFTGSSSRAPYIKLAKKMNMWGMPDSVRLRFNTGGITVTRVSLSLSTTEGKQIIKSVDLADLSEGENSVNFPISEYCDTSDYSLFPISFSYVQFAMKNIKSGTAYTFSVPGIELIYGNGKPTGITTVAADAAKAALSVYPNPVMAGATVSIAGAEGKVNIYNTAGQLVKEVTVDASGALSTAGMQPGIYLLRLTSGATARLMVK